MFDDIYGNEHADALKLWTQRVMVVSPPVVKLDSMQPWLNRESENRELSVMVLKARQIGKLSWYDHDDTEETWYARKVRIKAETKAKRTAYKEKFFSKRSEKKEVKLNPLLAKILIVN